MDYLTVFLIGYALGQIVAVRAVVVLLRQVNQKSRPSEPP
jgi:hypothetical protein